MRVLAGPRLVLTMLMSLSLSLPHWTIAKMLPPTLTVSGPEVPTIRRCPGLLTSWRTWISSSDSASVSGVAPGANTPCDWSMT